MIVTAYVPAVIIALLLISIKFSSNFEKVIVLGIVLVTDPGLVQAVIYKFVFLRSIVIDPSIGISLFDAIVILKTKS